jgi:response regulator RpfG family c-di-GMP phosphodiesterase
MHDATFQTRGGPEDDPRDAAAASSSAPAIPELEAPYPVSSRVRVLIVDEDRTLCKAFAAVLTEEGYHTDSVGSAEEALALLGKAAYDVMLSEICLPGKSGIELMEQVIELYPDLPVILLTGRASVDLAREALHKGASDFVTKPFSQAQLPIVVERNLTRRLVQRKNMLRYRLEIQASNESVLDALLSALDSRDTETQGHSERVTAYTMEIADLLAVSPEHLYHIERGALLHDIGKIGIPDRILLKPGNLTPEEWEEMKRHPVIGYGMCSRIEMLRDASLIVLHHHEAWDGSGYPCSLAGEAIPLGSRIFALADALDAITSNRPYRAAQPFECARQEIVRCSGSQFDPRIVEVFLSVPEARWQRIRSLTAGIPQDTDGPDSM